MNINKFINIYIENQRNNNLDRSLKNINEDFIYAFGPYLVMNLEWNREVKEISRYSETMRLMSYVEELLNAILKKYSKDRKDAYNYIKKWMNNITNQFPKNKIIDDKVEIGDTLFTLYKNKTEPIELIIDDYYEIN